MPTKIDSAPPRIAAEPVHTRQTERPRTPFRDILANGVGLLMSGAEAAGGVVGGPILAAAVHDVGTEVVGRVAGAGAGATAGATARPMTSMSGMSGMSMAASVGGPDVGGGAGSSPATSVQAMQRETHAMNVQLLALQEEIQNENRRFSTLSNVLRAQHDTAKAAVANIRS